MNCETNLCVLVYGFLHTSTPARPVQELLSEQSSLVLLSDAAEQRPAGTSLTPPEDTIRDPAHYAVNIHVRTFNLTNQNCFGFFLLSNYIDCVLILTCLFTVCIYFPIMVHSGAGSLNLWLYTQHGQKYVDKSFS